MVHAAAKPAILVNLLLEPPNVVTGITRYAFFLLEHLVRRGNFRIVLATTWSAEALPPLLRGLDVRTFPHVRSQPLNILQQTRILPRLMRESGAGLEFNPSTIGAFSGPWPRVVTVHDLYMKTMPELYEGRHRLWWSLFFPAILRSAGHVVCVSENTRRDLLRHYPAAQHKSSAVHSASGLSADRAPNIQRDPFFGLFVCSVSPNKGARTLVEAMAILEHRGCPVDIRHVGKDSLGLIAAARQEIGTTAGPRPLGFVSDEDLKHLYEEASFLAFPSVVEGFGLPILEAQTFGVPALASDLPVLREVAGEGASYFPPGDAIALADRIEVLARDPARWRALSRAACENAQRFSWDATAARMEEIFARAMGLDERTASPPDAAKAA